MKHLKIFFSIFSSLLILLMGPSSFAQKLMQENVPVLTERDILSIYLQQKQQAAMQELKTYRDRYDAVGFYAYPRVFPEDKIDAIAPLNKKGVLFQIALDDTYHFLKDAKPVKTTELAHHIVKDIVLHPRRVNVAKSIPMPKVGDTWWKAFYLASFYIQLGDFSRVVKNENATYADYQKYIRNNDMFMAQGYDKYDFTIAKRGYNTAVFNKRQQEIEDFIRSYTRTSSLFVRQVLVPLQTQDIDNADVAAYLDQHLPQQMPISISKQELKKVLMSTIPEPKAFYEQAAIMEPSFTKKMISLGKILHPISLGATKQDLFDALRLFDYISIGLYVEKLSDYGHLPSREEIIETLAVSMAAGALNESIAQIANDLFEFEKPFYYSHGSFGSAEIDIADNWYNIATNSFFSNYKVAEIASANILNSGRRYKQDTNLAQTVRNRKALQDVVSLKKTMPLVIDLVAGDMVLQMAAPLFKAGSLMNKVQADDVARALGSSSKAMTSASTSGKVASATSKAASTASKSATTGSKLLSKVAKADRVVNTGFENAVWRLSDEAGETLGFFKVGTKDEIARTRWFNDFAQKMRGKYNLIDIDYPRVIAEGTDGLPAHLQKQINTTLDDGMFQYYVREFKTRVKDPFTLSPVDPTGVNFMDSGIRPNPDEILAHLRGKPMSEAEWGEIMDFISGLNKEGFNHGDIVHNLYIKRQPNGKISLTMLDFELSGVGSKDLPVMEKFGEVLRRWGGIQ